MSLESARRVLSVEARALDGLAAALDETFLAAVDTILRAKGRLVVTGMGKSGIVARKIAATLASTGTPSFFLHPAEALHGDLGMVTEGDVVLALSNSGETEELLRLTPAFRRMGVPVVAITGAPGSGLASAATVHIPVMVDREACPLGLAPMASTTAQMALGDALAAALMERRGFQAEDFARLHPGGKLGKRLMKVSELMHAGGELPAVPPELPMQEVIYEISRKRLGVAVVAAGDGSVLGVITDGDLRRLLERQGGDLLAKTAGDCAVRGPATVGPDLLAAEALALLEKRKITSLVVTDASGKLLGVLHLHDLWGIQLI